MKKIMLAVGAALLIAAPVAGFAQDQGREHEGHAGGAPHAPPPAAAPVRPAAPQGAPQGGFHGAPQGGAAPTYHQPNGGAYRPQPNGQAGERPQNGGPTFPGGQGGYRPQPGQPGYHQGGPTFPGGQGGYRPQPGQPGYRADGPSFPGGQGGYRPQPGQPGYQGGGFHGGGYQGGHGGPPAGWHGPRAGAQAFSYGGRQFYRYHGAPYAFPQGYYGWSGHAWRRGEWLPSVFIAENYYINDWYDFGLYQPQYGYEWVRVGADALMIDLSSGQVVDVVPGVYYW